jgi:hypothetical protein
VPIHPQREHDGSLSEERRLEPLHRNLSVIDAVVSSTRVGWGAAIRHVGV